MIARLLRFSAAMAALCAAAAMPGAAPAGGADDIAYNRAQMKASHNSYAKKADMATQLGEWDIRSIEFDIHVEKKKPFKKAERAPEGDFLVFHNAMDDYSNCRLLSECLAEVRAFHESRPGHAAITIFFDMEGVGEPGHAREDLYGLFRQGLPAGSIFAPGDLLGRCPGASGLQEAVTMEGCSWPAMKELEGRFILVVSDGREAFREGDGYKPDKDLLFLVAKGSDSDALHADPDIVFFNMSGPSEFANEVHKAGFVSRCYWIDKQRKYEKARDIGCNHLATDSVDPGQFPWSTTRGPSGQPYLVLSPPKSK